MCKKLPGVWVDEPVLPLGASAQFLSEVREALEAELRSTVPADHFVTFLLLGALLFKIFFGHGASARWTLLRLCLLHPLRKGFVSLFRLCSLSKLEAAHASVPGLGSTAQAAALATFWAYEMWRLALLESHWVGAVGCWTEE